MLIHAVCKLTGLTKKAIEYYEKQGILRPVTTENGYRNYNDADVTVLKETAMLRKLGIGISDIRAILAGNDKTALLAACKSKLNRQMHLLNMQKECIDYLIDNDYNVAQTFDYITRQLDENRIIKERLAEAFPGNYGQFLSFHFGRFLNEKIDRPEKEIAYGKILDFLDSIEEFSFPQELKDYMTGEYGVWSPEMMQGLDSGVIAAVDDYEGYMADKRKIIELYLEYCKSEGYRASPAYKIKTLMMEFQKASGYTDIFVENMKVLSCDYACYIEKLRESNAYFLQQYPEAGAILADY